MNRKSNDRTYARLSAALLLTLALAACGGGSGAGKTSVTPPSPPPPPPSEPPAGTQMVTGQDYAVTANDRLVTTSLTPARIQVVYTLDTTNGEDEAKVRLLEGQANLLK